MCGIWAWIAHPCSSLSSYDVHEKMSHAQKIQHRGPDKSLVVMHPCFFFEFHRLAFHDLSPVGDQPMVFYEDDTTIYLMANAEIYNYRFLVEKYKWNMRSQNDCEVIYCLYQHFKGNMDSVVEELDGEFAFVMVVTRFQSVERIVAARDPYGVRPLFYTRTSDAFYFSSLASGLSDLEGKPEIHPFPPSTFFCIEKDGSMKWHPFQQILDTFFSVTDDALFSRLCELLIDAVRKRVTGERPLACLLSGGLDSSLVCAIMVKILGISIHTFSIGMEGSTDLVFAQQVADDLGTEHHRVLFTAAQGLEAIDQVIQACESWDITTIRASVGQFLLARHISEHTEFRAILNGDGADEVAMGYLYWYKAPSKLEAHLESLRRVKDIYLYDGLRVDRCLGYFGLEARLPYLDKAWVQFMLSTPIVQRMPSPTRMEKQLIRDAFAKVHPGLLPDRILWRKKEAFSDGVSSVQDSWFERVKAEMERRVSDEEFKAHQHNLGLPEIPPTKEAYYYQKIFLQKFGPSCHSLIPGYWLPKWSGDLKEPSARVLSVYSSSSVSSEGSKKEE